MDNIGVSLWLSWSKFTTFSIVMMSLCYLVPTVTLYILDLQPAGEQWKALSLILFSIVAILLLQLVKRSLRSADLNMALQKLDFCLMDSNTFYFQSIAACRYHVYFPLASIVWSLINLIIEWYFMRFPSIVDVQAVATTKKKKSPTKTVITCPSIFGIIVVSGMILL